MLFAKGSERVLSACWKFWSILCSWKIDDSFKTSNFHSKMLGQPTMLSNLPPGHAVTETAVPQQLRHQTLIAGAHWVQLWD